MIYASSKHVCFNIILPSERTVCHYIWGTFYGHQRKYKVQHQKKEKKKKKKKKRKFTLLIPYKVLLIKLSYDIICTFSLLYTIICVPMYILYGVGNGGGAGLKHGIFALVSHSFVILYSRFT